ncbi:MAG: hypothetical protein EHM93_01615 [Bacteroidales bacterium]|nr:MAG: hypothetical protein EHM93_01615 [Bacteroidales bacterium]
MTINRLNYEIFLIDYLDGRLNASQVDELLLFLDKNPDIKEELEGIDDTVLIANSEVFPNKSSLKKKSFLKYGIDNEFDYLCIASVEGIITQSENAKLQNIVNEDLLKQKQLLAFQGLKVNPDSSITFSDKQWLKRSTIIPIRYSNIRFSISIAASIALIIGVYTIGRLMVSNNPLENYKNSTIAESTSPKAIINTEEVNPKGVTIYKEQNKVNPESKIVNNPILIEKEEKKPRINMEESIPNMIHRIDYNESNIQINHETGIAQLASKYSQKNQILFVELYAQQENNKKINEFGAFEAIQYGVRSIGKLFGRDVKLDANKDKQGNIETIIFESKLVAFSTPLNND